jgi:2,4-dienoyl-CoA reductase (NADPH2)
MPQSLPVLSDLPHEKLGEDQKVIFQPLRFRNLTVKNRLFRSSISGTFDHYDGHGTEARAYWEESFAIGGIGAIISSFVPVSIRGRILTRYATIDDDDKIPFWKDVADRVRNHSCEYIMQLSHSGRQQDVGGVENLYNPALSSTSRKDYFHGIICKSMSRSEIRDVIRQFALAAKRAFDAGIKGVELHGANGYLITQFLSKSINDRTDEFGGSVANRARFVLEIVRAIRAEVKAPFHLQMKINGVDHNSWLYPWQKAGNTLEETLQICEILEDNGHGVDAFHVSSGSTFPHPRNPPGDIPVREASRWYGVMSSSGVLAQLNLFIFRTPVLRTLFRWLWHKRRGPLIEGINLAYAREVKKFARVPVIVTGGFQHASIIAEAIRQGWCDGVTIARPLIANRWLPKILQRQNGPDPGKECTYCNKCLINDLMNPLGCYELSRFGGVDFEDRYQRMIRDVNSVFTGPVPPSCEELLERFEEPHTM